MKDKELRNKADRETNTDNYLDDFPMKTGSSIYQRKADSYADILGAVSPKSESSYDSTGLTGSQEELGLTGSAGMNTNAGPFGQKGMSDSSDSFKNAGSQH